MPGLRLTPRADLAVYSRADALAHAALRPGVPYTLTQEWVQARFGHCPTIGFEMADEPIGGMILDGLEVHVAVLPQAYGRWALLMKPALAWVFSQRDACLARVAADNPRCIAFAERHRWRRLRADADSISYLLLPQHGTRKTDYHFARSATAAPLNPEARAR